MILKLDIDDAAGLFYAKRYGYTETVRDDKGVETPNDESVETALVRILTENIGAEAQQREAYEAGKAAEQVVLDRPRRPVTGEKAEALAEVVR